MQKYQNRRAAGVMLAEALHGYQNRNDVIVMALPRGGVPVGYEVAKALHAPLDVYIVRKLGVPGHHELAMGAIAQGGLPIFNQEIIDQLQVSPAEVESVIASEQAELKRRAAVYRGTSPPPLLAGKTVILVDDGIATGATMKAAIVAIRQQQPKAIITAVPVADQTIQNSFQILVDAFVCPLLVEDLHAVGLWYDDFSQTEDAEVHELLTLSRQE